MYQPEKVNNMEAEEKVVTKSGRLTKAAFVAGLFEKAISDDGKVEVRIRLDDGDFTTALYLEGLCIFTNYYCDVRDARIDFSKVVRVLKLNRRVWS
jgi:hypothetical protein